LDIERRSGKKPQGLLDKPDLPENGAYLWEMFCEIRGGVSGDITYQDIDAYVRLMSDNIAPWEVDAIIRIDLERKQQ
jgi:hypothetical protein